VVKTAALRKEHRGRRRGPRGPRCATTAAEAGHQVTLFEAAAEIGGQFNLARRIPGKEEFAETLRYFRRRIETTDVDLKLNRRVGRRTRRVRSRGAGGGDLPRTPAIPGIDHPKSRATSTSSSAAGRRGAAWRSSAPAASASTSASS